MTPERRGRSPWPVGISFTPIAWNSRRGQSTQAIRSALARGDLRDDDLVRPAGTTIPWARIVEMPELTAPEPEPTPEPVPTAPSPLAETSGPEPRLPDFEEIQTNLDEVISPPRFHHPTELPGSSPSDVAFPVIEVPDPPPLHPVGPPSALSPAWIWAEDEDEDEEDEEEDGQRGIESQEDIEILAEDSLDETGSVPTRSSDTSAQTHRPEPGRPLSELHSGPVESDKSVERGGGIGAEFGGSRSGRDRRQPVRQPGGLAGRALVRSRRQRDARRCRGEASFRYRALRTQRIEELDRAPMVDVAFQLVLFFMVTATTVLYKTLEIPKPSADTPAGAVAQGRSRSLDDLKDDYILRRD